MKKLNLKKVKDSTIIHPGDVLVVEVNPISTNELTAFTTGLAQKLTPLGVKCIVLSGASVTGVIRPDVIVEVKK
jgi:hypothetical protein